MPSDRFRSEVGSTEGAADPSPMSSVLDAREDTGLVQHTSDNRTESDEYPHPPLDANQENGRSRLDRSCVDTIEVSVKVCLFNFLSDFPILLQHQFSMSFHNVIDNIMSILQLSLIKK